MTKAASRARNEKAKSIIVSVGAIAASIVLFFLILVTVPLFLVESASVLGKAPPAWATWVPNTLAGFAIPVAYYRPILDALLLLAGMWAIIFTLIGTANFRRKLKQRAVVDSHAASDVRCAHKTMFDYYSDASELLICASDFDWIAKDQHLRGLLEDLGSKEKMKLFSHHDTDHIRAIWERDGNGELFAQFERHFSQIPSEAPKFSIIKHGSEMTFLSYIAMPTNQEVGPTNIAISSLKGPEARNLVVNIDRLLRSLVPNPIVA